MKRTLTILASALAIAACGQKPSDTTTLVAQFGDVIPAEVHVSSAAIDTTIVPEGKTLTVSVPVLKENFSVVETDAASFRFISDGTTVKVNFDGEKPEFKGAANSINGRLKAFNEWSDDFMSRYREVAAAIRELPEDEQDAAYDEQLKPLEEEYSAQSKKLLEANKDNILGLVGLQNVYDEMEPAELKEVIAGFTGPVAEHAFLKSLSKSVDAKAKTAEGMMFTDFEVETAPGKTEKLSDYVGKGKYMLVDFWASWCGPCKREIPNIKKAYERFHGDKFDILSVAVWERGNVQASLDTAKAYGINWNHMVNAESIPTDIYGIEGIPHIILFGPDGTILKRGLRGDAISEEIAKYVD